MSLISRPTFRLAILALAVTSLLALGFVMAAPPEADASPCYGTRYDYFETSACQVYTGTKVVCPCYPNQYDSGDNGGYAETSFVQTTQVTCPCPSGSCGGGGSNGDADPYDAEEDP